MSSSRKEEVPDEDSRKGVPDGKDGKTEKLEEAMPNYPIPEDWREHNFQDLFDNGWKPHLRKNPSGALYIALRRGRSDEIRLGAYKEERWELIQSMFPHKLPAVPAESRENDSASDNPEESPEPAKEPTMPVGSYFKVPIAKATVIPKAFMPRLPTLYWFERLKQNGFPGDLSDFLNDIVESHFEQCHSLFIQVMEKVPEGNMK